MIVLLIAGSWVSHVTLQQNRFLGHAQYACTTFSERKLGGMPGFGILILVDLYFSKPFLKKQRVTAAFLCQHFYRDH